MFHNAVYMNVEIDATHTSSLFFQLFELRCETSEVLVKRRSQQIMHFFSLHDISDFPKKILALKQALNLTGLALLERITKLVKYF